MENDAARQNLEVIRNIANRKASGEDADRLWQTIADLAQEGLNGTTTLIDGLRPNRTPPRTFGMGEGR